jgi:3-oxoacyl-[acyl-carrier-protein] synthase II
MTLSGDAHHITQPQNDGRGATLAMKRALDQSGLQADQIDYLNAHATSTPLGKWHSQTDKPHLD